MKISLVMATYNGAKYLNEQLDSIKNQTLKLDEVIIVDDVSTDDTSYLVEKYISNHQLNWMFIKNEKNLGYKGNFKKGLAHASGDVIFLCDQDDIWHLDKVERMVEALKNHLEIKALASSFNFVDGQGKPFSIEQKKGYANQNLLHKDVIDEIERVDLSLVKITNFSQGCCMAVRKEEVEIFLKNTQSKYPHDWELNLIAAMQDGCYFYNVPLIDYRIHDKNTIGLDDVIHNSHKELMKNRTIKRLNYIDEESYNTAVNNVDNGLQFKKGKIETDSAVYSYHTDALISQVVSDVSKKYNISEIFATNYINMAGLKIYSTQNSKIQKTAESEFEKSKYQIQSKNGGNSSQAAMVIIDHKTGYVGGLGKKTEVRPLNRATQSIRQTGSCIKPLSVLIPAIDKKIITASSIYDDIEQDFPNGYHPTDYNKPLGKITVRRAVESSQNIPFVEIMQQLQPQNSIKYLKKMGISTLTEEDETLVLALGGLQKGISTLEMAAGYAMIANDGEYIQPTFYTNINNSEGTTILKAQQKKKRVVSQDVAYIVKEILTQPVNGTKGTATYCKISGVDVAAKTGTTDENYDRWLCGFTPYYTAATWYGFDENETIEYNKRNPAGLLWANVMSKIHAGLKNANFEKPSTISTCNICSETGKIATTECTNVYTEYYLQNTIPDLCDKHSGTELKKNTTTKTQNENGTVEEITKDIDAIDPQQIETNVQ